MGEVQDSHASFPYIVYAHLVSHCTVKELFGKKTNETSKLLERLRVCQQQTFIEAKGRQFLIKYKLLVYKKPFILLHMGVIYVFSDVYA